MVKNIKSIKIKNSNISLGNSVFSSTSPEDTRRIGSDFARSLKPGSVICLLGQLGAGKTTFVQGMAKGLNIKESIKSPTFIIMREYPRKSFYHFDLYRIKCKEFLKINLGRYFSENNICVIEWPEKIKRLWQPHFIKVKISLLGQNERKIIIT